MITITDTEHVVRMIFPDSLKKDGGIHPNAFKLRQWPAPKGPEQYVSVNRYESETFLNDVLVFDKGRNLSCSLMPVGDIRSIKLFLDQTDDYPVLYDVRDTSTPEHLSHAGIFVSVSGMPLEGRGDAILDSIEEGKNKSRNLQAIRRMLSDLAAKTLTTVDSVCSQYRSQRS